MELILYFFLYSFFGWLCECIYCSIPAHTFINRGFLAGPYCPIYGCGALAVLHILDPFGYSIPLMFVMGIVVTSALEYVTSWGMEVLFHTKWWDYSSYPFNIHGRVCLKTPCCSAVWCWLSIISSIRQSRNLCICFRPGCRLCYVWPLFSDLAMTCLTQHLHCCARTRIFRKSRKAFASCGRNLRMPALLCFRRI
ncbi:MAG: putative ABC transporter permease [Clostridium sp.]